MANGEVGKPGAQGTEGGGTGGAGGRGGKGATGATGTTGSTGERGKTGKSGQPGVGLRAAVVGYLILLGFVFYGFLRVQDAADDAKAASEKVSEAVAANRDLLCDVGELVSDQPIARQRGETIRRYVERLDDYRGFLEKLRDIDCKGIVKNFPSREAERQARKLLREENRLGGPNGGGGRQQGNRPSQQPAPGNGGDRGNNGGEGKPPPNNPPNPPSDPLKPVCDVTNSVLPLPAVC